MRYIRFRHRHPGHFPDVFFHGCRDLNFFFGFRHLGALASFLPEGRIDFHGRLVSGGDGAHHRIRSPDRITTGENYGRRCPGFCSFNNFNKPFLGEIDSRFFKIDTQVKGLARGG